MLFRSNNHASNTLVNVFLALSSGPIQVMKDDDPIHIDIGIYGACPKKNFDKEKTIRTLEKFARDYNGYQVCRLQQ